MERPLVRTGTLLLAGWIIVILALAGAYVLVGDYLDRRRHAREDERHLAELGRLALVRDQDRETLATVHPIGTRRDDRNGGGGMAA